MAAWGRYDCAWMLAMTTRRCSAHPSVADTCGAREHAVLAAALCIAHLSRRRASVRCVSE
eukprot:4384067-Pleurochrysis_carterae.AAC.2